ncbi:MAG: hypothetical protein V1750_04250 [Acidobacteriota bacterium]
MAPIRLGRDALQGQAECLSYLPSLEGQAALSGLRPVDILAQARENPAREMRTTVHTASRFANAITTQKQGWWWYASVDGGRVAAD